jgi:hypothetical protein
MGDEGTREVLSGGGPIVSMDSDARAEYATGDERTRGVLSGGGLIVSMDSDPRAEDGTRVEGTRGAFQGGVRDLDESSPRS